jgi:hypothetical protein
MWTNQLWTAGKQRQQELLREAEQWRQMRDLVPQQGGRGHYLQGIHDFGGKVLAAIGRLVLQRAHKPEVKPRLKPSS